MRSSTGRWVSGSNFFDREAEISLLGSRIRDGNHVLLTGQRRMGKTSIARELGRRLVSEGWVFLFTDVEDATCAEDVVAEIAEATHPIQPISSQCAAAMKNWIDARVEEISALDFRVKIRAGLDAGSWRRYGEQLLRDCAVFSIPRPDADRIQMVDAIGQAESFHQGFQPDAPRYDHDQRAVAVILQHPAQPAQEFVDSFRTVRIAQHALEKDRQLIDDE